MVKLNNTQEIIGTDVLDHLGLIMSTINKLGIDKQIDKLIPMTKGAKTTMGQRASAIILNGLGFIDDIDYICFQNFSKISQLLNYLVKIYKHQILMMIHWVDF